MCFKIHNQFWGAIVAVIDKSVIHVNTKKIAYCIECFIIFQYIFRAIDPLDTYNRLVK